MRLSNKWKKRLTLWRRRWRDFYRSFKIKYKGIEVELYDINKKVEPYFRYLSVLLLLLAGLSLVLSVGFELTPTYELWNETLEISVIIGFIVLYVGRLILTTEKIELIKYRIFETILFLLIAFMGFYYLVGKTGGMEHLLGANTPYRVLITVTKISLVLIILVKFIQVTPTLLRLQKHPARLLTLSFLGIILLGAFMLMLPRATVDGQGLSFINALFTSTSAVCVTGLIVVDTATHFTLLGQIIIVVLIQLGGIGIVTFATFFALFITNGLGMGQMNFLRDIVNESRATETLSTIRRIIGLTLTIEFLGALVYFFSWQDLLPDVRQRMWFSIFHAVSAFCNAGFSLFTNSLADQANALNWGVNLTTVILIVMGGLGFTTLWELFRGNAARRVRSRKLSVHSKLVLISTTILIVVGTLLVLGLEWDNTLKGYSTVNKVMISLFQSVTTRTAGFNTIDIGALGISTTIVMMLLMAIGASPASTGGGIKTTTISVLVLSVIANVKGHDRIEFSQKTIPDTIVFKAITAFMLAALSLFLSTLLLTITENLPFTDLLFEEISAYATVGLSRGITAQLSEWGKLIIIVSMFIGRVGSLTLAAAFAKQVEKQNYRYPSESVMVA